MLSRSQSDHQRPETTADQPRLLDEAQRAANSPPGSGQMIFRSADASSEHERRTAPPPVEPAPGRRPQPSPKPFISQPRAGSRRILWL